MNSKPTAKVQFYPQLHALFYAQDGKCAICRRSSDDLEIDHDHGTGFVRGLLCSRCNMGIGFYERFMRLGLLRRVRVYVANDINFRIPGQPFGINESQLEGGLLRHLQDESGASG